MGMSGAMLTVTMTSHIPVVTGSPRGLSVDAFDLDLRAPNEKSAGISTYYMLHAMPRSTSRSWQVESPWRGRGCGQGRCGTIWVEFSPLFQGGGGHTLFLRRALAHHVGHQVVAHFFCLFEEGIHPGERVDSFSAGIENSFLSATRSPPPVTSSSGQCRVWPVEEGSMCASHDKVGG
jgi:hypothetical protein